MTPAKYDITIYRGGTFNISFEGRNKVGVLTDYESVYDSMKLQVRLPWKTQGSASNRPLLELSTANGGIIVSGTNITLNISAEDTTKLAFDEGKYDLEMIIDATVDPVAPEVVDKLIYGSVNVIGEMTI